MCKCFNKLDSIVLIETKGRSIKFSSNSDNIMKRSSEFGDCVPDDVIDYQEKFDMDQIAKISKISGFGRHMQIHTRSECPILFKSDVSSLGTISIYVKSIAMKKAEKDMEEDF